MLQTKTYNTDFGGRDFSIQLNNWADQANGSALVRYGDTLVFATVVMSKGPREGTNFFPLLVDYQEKFYASGKIKGSRFIKREGRPSDEATLIGRMIDRSIRPRFDMRIRNDVQIVAETLSFDKKHDPDIPALIASSAALAISDIPWNGPIGAVKIGRINGEYILNPSLEDAVSSDFLITLAGTKDKINMIEAVARETPEDELVSAFEFGAKQIKKIVEFQEEIVKEVGLAKKAVTLFTPSGELQKEVEQFLGNRLELALFTKLKQERMDAVTVLKEELKDYLGEKYGGTDQSNISVGLDFFEEKINQIVHESIILQEKRVDGRKLDELRPLESQAALLPRVHGSGLFMRGNTHALASVTLGAPGLEQIIDEMEGEYRKRFMLHYNFPAFSVGEVAPMRSPGRREIGHGALAEKALEQLLPLKEDFPYTIRIVSEILSSNGSSSMASVCAGSIALMDAGVPVKRPAAGIAMGLMTAESGEYKILTDIQGPEDHHGDMDFKVAGTKEGVTAIQMDVKIDGVTTEILDKTLKQAKKARLEILENITKTIPAPRESLSRYAPRIFVLQISPEKIGDVIGPGGKIINEIIAETGVLTIDIEDDGKIYVAAEPEKEDSALKAISWIKNITREIKLGEIFDAKVVKVAEFGAFVELTPKQEGLVHVSELSNKYVGRVSDIVKVGDIIRVKVIRIDEHGKIALSAKNGGTRPAN